MHPKVTWDPKTKQHQKTERSEILIWHTSSADKFSSMRLRSSSRSLSTLDLADKMERASPSSLSCSVVMRAFSSSSFSGMSCLKMRYNMSSSSKEAYLRIGQKRLGSASLQFVCLSLGSTSILLFLFLLLLVFNQLLLLLQDLQFLFIASLV